ncbi:MAG: hypothetical protein OIN86_13145 [Candidatus Methanoperedens sp.]|nr:hypothetical protein [Candidatus Methanoperedens sp.]CAG0949157.1 hypothetical protein METP1_00085 [Methanosarcinales archaeon]
MSTTTVFQFQKDLKNEIFYLNLPCGEILYDALYDSGGIKKFDEGFVGKCKYCPSGNFKAQNLIKGLKTTKLYLLNNPNWSGNVGKWEDELTDYQAVNNIINDFISALKTTVVDDIYINNNCNPCTCEKKGDNTLKINNPKVTGAEVI